MYLQTRTDFFLNEMMTSFSIDTVGKKHSGEISKKKKWTIR